MAAAMRRITSCSTHRIQFPLKGVKKKGKHFLVFTSQAPNHFKASSV